MWYDTRFIESLPLEPNQALLAICDKYNEYQKKLRRGSTDAHHRLGAETLGLIRGLVSAIGYGFKIHIPKLEGPQDKDITRMNMFMCELRDTIGRVIAEDGIAPYNDLLLQKFGTGVAYEFSEGDLARVQKLVNELRDLIAASEELEADHKRRVLGRLEKLQSELHKKMSDLSHLWGVLIEASMVARKMGKNAKPVVDRIREIAGIAGPTQARSFGLPSNTPFRLPGQIEEEKS
jgi:hypothetical protein